MRLWEDTITVGDDALDSSSFLDWWQDSRIRRDGQPAIMYHQTAAENVESIHRSGFQVNRVGARQFDEQMPNGIFFKPTNVDIGIGGKSAAQLPYVLSVQNPLYLADRYALGQFLDRDSTYSAIASKIGYYNSRIKATSETMYNRLTAQGHEAPLLPHFDRMFARTDRIMSRLAAHARQLSTQIIRRKGYDGLVIERDQGGTFGNRTTKTVVVFSPRQARRVKFIW